MIQAAIDGFVLRQQMIDRHIAELRTMLPATNAANAEQVPWEQKRTLSPATRKKMAEAQRRRYAAQQQQPTATGEGTPATPTAKRKLSAEGRKRIQEAARRRWANAKLAGGLPVEKVEISLGGRPTVRATRRRKSAQRATTPQVMAAGSSV
jgi:hypothetical protein